jgi:hypothetical protein
VSWKQVKDEPLPKDRAILAVFKGWIGVLEWIENEQAWYFVHDPASCNLASLDRYGEPGIQSVDSEFLMKIHYWQDLPKHPDC